MNPLLAALILASMSGGVPSTEELVERSVAYHDPHGVWESRAVEITAEVRLAERLAAERGYTTRVDRVRIHEAAGEFHYRAEKAGIPFFVNPYYLSLLHVRTPYFAIGADQAIRNYVLYSPQMVQEFGNIVAWEKEDLVKPGEPNAAGWLLPSAHNVHRRYPEVAILIPDTVGRACGGLCASCQRMYNFQ